MSELNQAIGLLNKLEASIKPEYQAMLNDIDSSPDDLSAQRVQAQNDYFRSLSKFLYRLKEHLETTNSGETSAYDFTSEAAILSQLQSSIGADSALTSLLNDHDKKHFVPEYAQCITLTVKAFNSASINSHSDAELMRKSLNRLAITIAHASIPLFRPGIDSPALQKIRNERAIPDTFQTTINLMTATLANAPQISAAKQLVNELLQSYDELKRNLAELEKNHTVQSAP